MNHRVKLAVLILVGLSAAAVSSAKTSAISQTPSGTTVSPAFQQVSIKASQTEQPITFSLTNNEPTAETLTLSTQDFNTLDETGGLFFVGSNPTDLQKKYGLAKWLSLPTSQVTVQPKQTVQIKADIINVPSMPAGGHYGALLISLAGAQAKSSGNVALHPIASSLLFVTKLGGDTHFLKLTNVYVSRRLFGLPSSLTLRFYNDGNTHLTPRGIASVTNSNGGKIISKGVVNEDSGIILPLTYRRYSVQLGSVNSTFWPGRYKLSVYYRFDGINQFREYQISFWVISPDGLIFTILLISFVIVLVYLVIMKRHKFRRRAKYPLKRHK